MLMCRDVTRRLLATFFVCVHQLLAPENTDSSDMPLPTTTTTTIPYYRSVYEGRLL